MVGTMSSKDLSPNFAILTSCCISLFSIAATKTVKTKKQPGERAYYSLPRQSIIKRSQGRSWSSDHGGILFSVLILMVTSPCFYLQLGSQEWHSLQKAVPSHISSQSSKMPDRLAYRPVWLRFLVRGSCFPDEPSLTRQTIPFREGGVTDRLGPLLLRKECTCRCSPSIKQAACNIAKIFADRLCIRNFQAWLF